MPAVADRPAGEEQPVELASLREERRLRRIQVLRLPVAQHAAAEADDLAARIVDREHDPIAKPVVALAGLAGDDEPGSLQRGVVVAFERRRQGLPRVGRVADAEMRGDRPGEAPLLQVFDRTRRILQLCPIVFRGSQRHCGEIVGLLAPLGLAGALDAGHGKSRVARELLDRIGKAFPAVLHQEPDRSAVGAAAEAVIELLRSGSR